VLVGPCPGLGGTKNRWPGPVDWVKDLPAPEDVAATFCATLAEEWTRAGVTDVVVAPGSRSTPLALAVAEEPRLRAHVHHDERSAGFMALGLGLAAGRPAVVVTTSGTAAVELHPSVVEAHQARVPLIVATADRPPELRGVGAPQTIDQVHVFGRSVRWFAEPGVAEAAVARTWRSLAARSVAEALGEGQSGIPGPVHLNLSFREPLIGRAGSLPPVRAGEEPWHTGGGARTTVTRLGLERLRGLLDASRGLIVAGRGAADLESVFGLARATGWPVLADARSGCRVPDPAVIGAFDAMLRHRSFADGQRPDVVLRLGEPPASKVLGHWLADGDARQVLVHADGAWVDPDHALDHVLRADPTSVCTALARTIGTPDAAWLDVWRTADDIAQVAIEAILSAHAEPTEPGIARAALAAVPDDATVIVASSMPVRDLEWYASPRSNVRVLANRGANGIDGVVSTAAGVALAEPRRPTVALLGDVAFLHDTNGLLNLHGRSVDLTIVVVDNDGGGIFSFLPQNAELERERFEQLFGTPHGVDLTTLAAAHGIMTIEPAGAAEVGPAIAASVGTGGVRVVRIRTDRRSNVVIHDEIHAEVACRLPES